MTRVNAGRAPIVFLFLASCFPAGAWQTSGLRATDASGRTVVSTYDSSGKLMSVMDGAGEASCPGAPSASGHVSSGSANSQTAAASSAPVTINVPADQPTIQAAINAANNGDTVLVSDGTYQENINFNGKAITASLWEVARKGRVGDFPVWSGSFFVSWQACRLQLRHRSRSCGRCTAINEEKT